MESWAHHSSERDPYDDPVSWLDKQAKELPARQEACGSSSAVRGRQTGATHPLFISVMEILVQVLNILYAGVAS